VKRPQTHDLLANVITSLGGRLESITITDLSDHTFFATLDVRSATGEKVHIDSRPSDAIALGVANDVPIYVNEHVLESALTEEPDEP
jgi:bifunctional DNase/RNase